MGNQVVIEPFLDDKKQIQWRVIQDDSVPKTEVMKAEQHAMAGIFSEAMPAIGGGALAAFTGAVADKFLGGLGGGIVGNLGKAIPRVGAAWALHQWASKRWPTATKYAIAFLIYDAVNGFINIDAQAKGFGNQLASGLPMLGGTRDPTAVPVGTSPTQVVGDPLTAGWV